MDLKLKKNKEVPITNLKENFYLSSSAEDLKRSDFFYLPFLESIVNTSSFSDDANGVNEVQENLGRKLFQLGFETQFIKNGEIVSGDLLHSFSGRGAINVTLVCHADKVFKEKNNTLIFYDPSRKKKEGEYKNLVKSEKLSYFFLPPNPTIGSKYLITKSF